MKPWLETIWPDVWVHVSGRVVNRKTTEEYKGFLIEVLPGHKVSRPELVLSTFDPPPKDMYYRLQFKDGDTTNWHLDNLQWIVKLDEFVKVAANYTDEQLAECTPMLIGVAQKFSWKDVDLTGLENQIRLY